MFKKVSEKQFMYSFFDDNESIDQLFNILEHS